VTARPLMRSRKIDLSVLESREAALQMVERRRALESEAAVLAAQRRSSNQLVEIEAAFAAIDTEVAAGGDGVVPDSAFHRAIAHATGNPHLLKTLDFLTQFLTAATRVTRSNEARRVEFMRQVREEHLAIIEAIRRHDSPDAENAAALTCSMQPGGSALRNFPLLRHLTATTKTI
jgi:GntR family transcriptional repressor for pyruvate dehydrogenase complex